MAIAAEAPPDMMGLILCCSFARNPRPALAGLRPIVRLLSDIRSSSWIRFALHGRQSNHALHKQLEQALSSPSAQTTCARLRMILGADATTALQHNKMPILYLRARNDGLVPFPAGRYIADTKPRAQIVDIDPPHMLLHTQPKAAAEIVLEFTIRISDNLGKAADNKSTASGY